MNILSGQTDRYKSVTNRDYDQRSIGFGLGIDYGSIVGYQYAHYFNRKLGAFMASGLLPLEVNVGIGMKYRPWIYQKPNFLTHYFMGMIGPVKGGIANADFGWKDKVFHGLLSGAGLEVRDKQWKKIFLGLVIHLYTDFDQFKDYQNELSKRGIILDVSDRSFTFSLGFHYTI